MPQTWKSSGSMNNMFFYVHFFICLQKNPHYMIPIVSGSSMSFWCDCPLSLTLMNVAG